MSDYSKTPRASASMASQNQPQDPVTEEKETPLVLIDPRLILPGLGDTMKDYLYSQRMQQNSVTSALVKQIQQDSELGPKIAENERDNLEPFIRKRAKLTKRLLALGTGERSAARRRRIRRLKAIASARTTSTNPPASQQTRAAVPPTNPPASQQTSAAVPPTYANLPDAVLVAMLDQPYDEAWMITYHVSNNLLEGWTSGKKFDSLVNHGALKVGDKIYYAVGAQREYVAKVSLYPSFPRRQLKVNCQDSWCCRWHT